MMLSEVAKISTPKRKEGKKKSIMTGQYSSFFPMFNNEVFVA